MSKKAADFPIDPRKVEVFFDVRDASYWHKVGGTFLQLGVKNLHMQFRSMGLTDQSFSNGQREIDWPLWNAMNYHKIHYAGSLAGHRVGLSRDATGCDYLITQEPNIQVFADMPKKVAKPKFFSEFVEELLPDGQADHFCFWLSAALKSLRRGDFKPGQVCILVGESNCGKSFLQDIITAVFGGRDADPIEYLTAKTQFNAELITAEHWKIEDPESTTDIRSRKAFGDMLKKASFTRTFKIHKKGKDGLTFPIFRRISISINDELENLSRIPPLDPSLQDKINIYRCGKARASFEPFLSESPLPGMNSMVGKLEVDRLRLWKYVTEEVPQIRAWLLSQFSRVPADLSDSRTGLRSYHHSELLIELQSLAPEMRLLQLIDYVYFNDEPPFSAVVDIKAFDLEKELVAKAETQTRPIAKHQNWAGNYLGKLFKSENPHWKSSNDEQFGRISKRLRDGTTLWTIKPPSINNEEK